jgi:hypothetical protein
VKLRRSIYSINATMSRKISRSSRSSAMLVLGLSPSTILRRSSRHSTAKESYRFGKEEVCGSSAVPCLPIMFSLAGSC